MRDEQTGANKRIIARIALCFALAATVALAVACSSSNQKEAQAGADGAYQRETDKAAKKDSQTVDYLEEFPFLATVYEGSGFAKSYESARSHNYALKDVKATPRISETSKATCFACKTAQYTEMEKEQGDKLYTTLFSEVKDKMTEGISCVDCHKDSSGAGGETIAIRSHFNNAFGDLVERDMIPSNTAACAQCHNEYYFSPDNGAVALPKHLTSPTDILAYYNEIGYVDHENPRTGTQQLKAQHPEFQTLSGSMHDKFGVTCSDCHMEKTEVDGKLVTSHDIVSPLDSEIIMNDVCLPCHTGETKDSLEQQTFDIQKGVRDKTFSGGELLAELSDTLAAAVSDGSHSKAELDAARKLHRDAQWYWDWVFVENGDGFHNPKEANFCLDESVKLANKALKLLQK